MPVRLQGARCVWQRGHALAGHGPQRLGAQRVGQLLQQLALVGLLGLAHPELGVVLPDAPLHTPGEQSATAGLPLVTPDIQPAEPRCRVEKRPG